MTTPTIQALGLTQEGSPTRWQATGYVDGMGWLAAWGPTLITAMEALQALVAERGAERHVGEAPRDEAVEEPGASAKTGVREMNHARQQLAKVKRSFDRIQNHGADDLAYDDLMHFFEDCWHLKDHAKTDLLDAQKVQFEKDVNSYPHLKIVADLANRSKHAVLTKPPRVDAKVAHKHIHAYDGSYAPPATAKYTVTLQDGSIHDAHEIAQQAIAEWQTILAKYNL